MDNVGPSTWEEYNKTEETLWADYQKIENSTVPEEKKLRAHKTYQTKEFEAWLKLVGKDPV